MELWKFYILQCISAHSGFSIRGLRCYCMLLLGGNLLLFWGGGCDGIVGESMLILCFSFSFLSCTYILRPWEFLCRFGVQVWSLCEEGVLETTVFPLRHGSSTCLFIFPFFFLVDCWSLFLSAATYSSGRPLLIPPLGLTLFSVLELFILNFC